MLDSIEKSRIKEHEIQRKFALSSKLNKIIYRKKYNKENYLFELNRSSFYRKLKEKPNIKPRRTSSVDAGALD